MKLKKKIKKMGDGMYYIRIPKTLVDVNLLETDKWYQLEITELKD